VLIKNAEALENMNKVNVLITDKTGTITEENLLLKKVFAINNDEDHLLQLIASKSIQRASAQAVVNLPKQKYRQEAKNFEAVTGKGYWEP
jgi:Cu2+-exporting ATPase